MAQIIITVYDQTQGCSFDTEVPDDVPSRELLDDLIQALQGADPQLYWELAESVLYSPKLGRILHSKKTLSEEGIWNGDYLQIRDIEI